MMPLQVGFAERPAAAASAAPQPGEPSSSQALLWQRLQWAQLEHPCRSLASRAAVPRWQPVPAVVGGLMPKPGVIYQATWRLDHLQELNIQIE